MIPMSTNTDHTTPDRVPPIRGPHAVEAWFAAAGLQVTVVDGCPDRACPRCAPAMKNAA
jgi:hypothetical protein